MKSFFYLCWAGIICLANSTRAQEIEFETVKINDHFYVIYGGSGHGSNVGVLIQEEGILLVDAMVEESGEKLLKAIRALSDKPIRYVFNTHGHFDHSGSNGLFKAQGAIIIAHDHSLYDEMQADVTFSDRFTLNFGNETIQAWHSPSHSHSDITIFLKQQNALFLGDIYSNIWHPTFYATGMAGQYRYMEQAKAVSNEQTNIVPGHGFITDLSEIEHYLEGCRLWMSRMTELTPQHHDLEVMLNDSELLKLRQRFTARRPKGDMPDMNFQRLIQRTISSEFVKIKPLEATILQQYIGAFQDTDGIITKVFMEDNKLMAGVENEHLIELLPLGENRFHLRALIDQYFIFQTDESGQITGISHEQSSGSQSLKKLHP